MNKPKIEDYELYFDKSSEEWSTYAKALETWGDELQAEVKEWKRYTIDLEEWFYHKYDSYMAKAMSKPNKPGYHIANNDYKGTLERRVRMTKAVT